MKHYPRELKLEAMRMFYEEGKTPYPVKTLNGKKIGDKTCVTRPE